MNGPMELSQNEEKSLVCQAQGGSREALGKLYDSITPKLFGYLVNVVNDKTTAEDIFQDTWQRAIEALPKYQIRQNIRLSAWIFAIARNECKKQWLKSGQANKFEPEKQDEPSAEPDKIREKILVEQTLLQLSENDREIIRLYYISDLTLNEIAAILNINSITVRVRIYRALKRARTILVGKTS
jgi:RNA polymerase sigma factor (sigma-70 family)